MRRCGVPPSAQTPEIIQMALDNLFLLLLMLSSRGINLWTVDKRIIPITSGQALYVLHPGTIDLLNVAYAQPTLVTGTNASTTTSYSVVLASANNIPRVAITFSVLPTAAVSVQGSNDGATWTTLKTVALGDLPAVNALGYFDLDNISPYSQYRVLASVGTFTCTALTLCSQISELPIKQMNRDDYSALPNKYQLSRPSVNYYYEKLVNPQVTLWPVPNNSTDQLVVWRYRQPQDVGTLTQVLEIPSRWFEAVIWQLAGRMAFELPAIDPQRKADVLAAMDKFLIVTEGGETDGSPIYLAPNIAVYTA